MFQSLLTADMAIQPTLASDHLIICIGCIPGTSDEYKSDMAELLLFQCYSNLFSKSLAELVEHLTHHSDYTEHKVIMFETGE